MPYLLDDIKVMDWTQGHTPQEAAELLQSAGVAAAPSISIRDLNEDAHLKARGAWQEVQHPVLGAQKVQRRPLEGQRRVKPT